ncbi:MAG: hypothetical protein PHI50_04205 [Alphaproteobacteria bacterium]|nr:hypothetical protein [Alphaproteobacteria bacterium]
MGKYNFINTLTEKEIEVAKDPGLNIRFLHKKGYTGKGVHVAIIDQGLVEHYKDIEEYGNQVVSYNGHHESSMHGPGVLSLLAGKTCGVAPDAKVHYFARYSGTEYEMMEKGLGVRLLLAQKINEIIDLNKTLPPQEKIRVISASAGWDPLDGGATEINKAVRRAIDNDIFPLTTSAMKYSDLDMCHARCELNKDRNNPKNYTFGKKTQEEIENDLIQNPKNPKAWVSKMVTVPTNNRVYSNSEGDNGFAFDENGMGGLSWGVPWVAGMYALACQADETMTMDRFIEKVNKTKSKISIDVNGTKVNTNVFSPLGLINSIREDQHLKPLNPEAEKINFALLSSKSRG